MKTRKVTTLVLTGSILLNGGLMVNSYAHEKLSNKQSEQLNDVLALVEEKQETIKELNASVKSLNDEIKRLENDTDELQLADTKSLGLFEVTAYCPCVECSEGYGTMTSTGATATENRTVAVDPNVIAYGTTLEINGNTYIAEDCGGAIKGNIIDIYFDTHAEALAWGRQSHEVYIVN